MVIVFASWNWILFLQLQPTIVNLPHTSVYVRFPSLSSFGNREKTSHGYLAIVRAISKYRVPRYCHAILIQKYHSNWPDYII